MDGASMEMPRYVSHKEVWALKIKAIAVAGGRVTLSFDNTRYADRDFSSEEMANKPSPREGWYMVQYKDGYVSFSPAEQFEEGYTLLSK